MRWRLIAMSVALTIIMGLIQMTSDTAGTQDTVVSRINAVWYDMRFRLWPPERPPLVPIVIVDIDEASLQNEGRWPWDRAKVGALIDALAARGAVLTGLDVVFSEASLNPIQALLDDELLSEQLRSELAPMTDRFDSDAQLAEVLSEQTVLGYFFHRDGYSTGELPPPLMEFDGAGTGLGLLQMPDYTANLSVLTEHALTSGYIVAIPDVDGVMRRMPLLLRHGQGIYSSLSLEMARILLNAPWLRLVQAGSDDGPVIGVAIGRSVVIDLDRGASLLVPYKGGAQSFPTISATDVLRGTADEATLAQLEGAVVLVGTSALGLADLRTTPLQTGYPGVEAHANVLDVLLQAAVHQHETQNTVSSWTDTWRHPSPLYHQPDWESGADLILLLAAGFLLAFLLPGRAPVVAIIQSGLVMGGLVLFNIVSWQVFHLALPLALQVLTVMAVAGLNITMGYLQTAHQKHMIQRLFGEYVPEQHVQRMLQDPEAVSLDGEQREMTVLFADVRGFTAVSEKLTASELKSMLNDYLSAVTKVIFDHHGTIDKYVGDMVMAFWNAPLNDPHHAKNAVAAALAMQARMEDLRKEFVAKGWPPLRIGIGLNTGMMNVGDMGSHYRRAYTVLGDAVNLGARLESLTAHYGVPILVSDVTREAAPEFIYQDIDYVRVKGRSAPLYIYEPIAADADPVKKAQTQGFGVALDAYRSGDLAKAQALFEALLQAEPDSVLYRLYLQRIEDADWDQAVQNPVFSHSKK
ncbi:CHASE2 domain-containing protein [Orrella sp. 11846]|uniref:CHASE2 domain-containing protein n=1 Tax=Orrella sp. 11846 TaxID=3409913 RepID=UPI003B5CFDFC